VRKLFRLWMFMRERKLHGMAIFTAGFAVAAVAVLSLPYLSWLISPANLLIGGVVGGLVGLNAVLGYLAWRQPRACRLGSGSGMLAATPGLLAGSACCAPSLLLLLGLPASAFLLSLFSLMVPIALVLLIMSLLATANRVDPQFASQA
jgi:hypothetical protein